jgi:hypothetical protein
VAVLGFFVVTLDGERGAQHLPPARRRAGGRGLRRALVAHRETFVQGMQVSLVIAALLLLATTAASLRLRAKGSHE